MSDLKPVTVGTAGHIDHGKTALVEALTGTNTDRLAEEHRRGISIELGFAELALPDGRTLSVVDVPGHERFVRTMVAGASGIDLCLLVVAADDGIMPQTREHLAVVRALGIRHGVIAVTKADVVDAARVAEIAGTVGLLLPDAPLVVTSARQRRGLTELSDALAVAAARAASGGPRGRLPGQTALHIDRAFSLKGIGTVVTGTLQGGTIGRGETVLLQPHRRTARVRSVQVHNRAVERAEPRQRVALNLAGVRRTDVQRGDVVVRASATAGIWTPSYRVEVELLLESHAGSLDGERVQIHHGTRETPARCVYLDDAGRFAQLRLESVLVAQPGERAVLRSIARPDTLGGAEIVDPAPSRHGRGRRAVELGRIVDGAPRELIVASLGAETRVPLDPERWSNIPLLGVARARHSLRAWVAAISELARDGLLTERNGLAIPAAREPIEPAAELPSVEVTDNDVDVLRVLERDGTRPRSTRALADELGCLRSEVMDSIGRLSRAGLAVRLGIGIVYEAGEYERLRERLLSLIRGGGGSISLAETRDALATSRKYAQAWLEHLNGIGVTIRRGDRHHLRSYVGRQGSGGPAGLQSQ